LLVLAIHNCQALCMSFQYVLVHWRLSISFKFCGVPQGHQDGGYDQGHSLCRFRHMTPGNRCLPISLFNGFGLALQFI
jgi:hypothetical protein